MCSYIFNAHSSYWSSQRESSIPFIVAPLGKDITCAYEKTKLFNTLNFLLYSTINVSIYLLLIVPLESHNIK